MVVEIQGVPARGLVGTGCDITIIGGQLFRHVAAMARLRKRHFKPPDKAPHTYNRQPFHLDGQMDLKVSFGKELITHVYVKMDALDQLLLFAASSTTTRMSMQYPPIARQWIRRSCQE